MKKFSHQFEVSKLSYFGFLFALILSLLFPLSVQAATKHDDQLSLSSYSFKTGKDFFTYENPFPSDKGKSGKEVTMKLFFAYDCKTCLTALDSLHVYQKQHKNIRIELQPVAVKKQTFSADVYYTLSTLGHKDLAEQLIFDSTGYENKKLTLVNEKNFTRWLAKHGITSSEFMKALNLVTVQNRVNYSVKDTAKYGVFTVPFLVIDGQYVLTKNTLFDDDYTYAVLNFLMDKIEAQRQQAAEKQK